MTTTTSTRPLLAIQRLSPHAVLPEYQTEHAAGLDLHAALEAPLVLEPGAIALIPTGLAVAIPVGHEGQVRPRSGLAAKHGISIPNTPGTIDADYRGEVRIALINLSRTAFTIEPQMRIAQMVIAPVTHCRIDEVEQLDETARGAGGFGSTGL